MAEISAAVNFTSQEKSLIESKLKDPAFTHANWQDEDLVALRCAVRDHYRNEQAGVCAYCRNPVSLTSAQNAHVEHIAPKSKYLKFIFEPKNLCVICADCSAIKQNQEVLDSPDTIKRKTRRYPRSSSAFRIVHPHFDKWDDHILKVHGFFVDRTPKGHFTIGACVLNRKLRQFGWAPSLTDNAGAVKAMHDLVEGATIQDRAVALALLLKALSP